MIRDVFPVLKYRENLYHNILPVARLYLFQRLVRMGFVGLYGYGILWWLTINTLLIVYLYFRFDFFYNRLHAIRRKNAWLFWIKIIVFGENSEYQCLVSSPEFEFFCWFYSSSIHLSFLHKYLHYWRLLRYYIMKLCMYDPSNCVFENYA